MVAEGKARSDQESEMEERLNAVKAELTELSEKHITTLQKLQDAEAELQKKSTQDDASSPVCLELPRCSRV